MKTIHKIPQSSVYISLGAFLLIVAYLILQTIYGLEELIAGQSASFDWSQLLIQNPRVHWVSMLVRTGILLAVVLWSRRTINAIQKDRELIRQIPETVADGIYLVDREGRMTFANTAVEKIIGLSRDAILRRTYDDANWKITTLDGKPFPDQAQPFVRVMQTGEPVHGVEQSIERPDGTRVIVSVNAAPIRDADGRVIGEVGSVTDITERKRAEAALREGEDRYRELYEKAPIAYYSVDAANAQIRIANQRMAEMLGYRLDDLIGRSIFDLYPDTVGGKTKVREIFDKFRAGEETRGEELQMRRADGTLIWVNLSVRPVRDANGNVVYSRATAINITERKEAEEALHKSEARHRALLEAIPDAIWHIDRDGVLRDYKPPKDLFPRLPIEQYIGKRVDQVEPIQAGRQILQHLTEAVRSAEPQTFEYQLLINQTIYDREARMVPVGENDALMIVRDITDRKKMDRLKNEFISMVSHELRTPLTSIRGSLGLVAGGAAGQVSPQAKSLVNIAYKNSERLIRLINDILDIEKIESGKMVFDLKPIELMPLLAQAIEANSAYGQQFGVEFVLEKQAPGVQVDGDPDRLIQVVTNLLSNAVKFSSRGSTVDIGVSRYDSSVRVSVRDHGPGIPEEFRNRIFQKFAQADSSNTRQKGGTGLGLSISKAIVERLGGQIGYETALNEGTTFYFDLPELRAQVKTVKPISLRKPRVLICEDDHDTAMLLKLMLEQSGYAPEIAYDAKEAKEMLRRNDYAGMTLDLVLPDQDGISLIRDLRDQDKTRDLSIVVVSMSAEKGQTELNGDAVQVIDWISKPIDPERLLRAVKQAVSRTAGRAAHILHVDDDPDILQVVSVILRDVAQVDRAPTLVAARKLLREKKYELVILDLEMPDGSGIDLVPLLQEQEPPVPAVIFSVEEVKRETAEKVSATLVKSRTSNEKLVQTIQSLLRTPVPA